MSWTEIVIEVSRHEADALSDALMNHGALSVSLEDADEGTEAEQPLFGEPGLPAPPTAWEHSRVIALIAADIDPADLIATAANSCDLASTNLSYTSRVVEEQNWVRLTQSQFEPIFIGKNIWVVPSWHDAPDPNGLVLAMDPGLAFGTGSHPTTRLCMEWLETQVAPGCSVLDYGCGSGILAMLAKKLGATQVVGVDIDPQAIESARYNSQSNHCVVDYYLPEIFSTALSAPTFDIVVANILASPLKLMASMLSDRVAPGGVLVLSGILERQAEEIMAAYAPFIDLTVTAERDGWVLMTSRPSR